ncbi:hypothetical protein DWQ65_01585 [Treponema phagedenis]|uniref:Outer membrane lipoprotein-sorting protein n=1 Tax=Treponema phagedenis TaxID=162 RepID=A0A0B7GWM1_TREPH|nr:hypothetical protein [Treponema phagedenis]EFW36778.1 hypothetical protein HMPREF9554_02741 [Treponema phagedenis F0421]NVP25076.1 hypothetical protein [Treponema phagedenis]QEJ94012.1 outer membrane lipoprotein-sorting protein [Treponema phagedenis]QEJ97190.1 outer membrane lipoprotein-sorting protein [Treponema phagedenis]QEK01981.1 outer membrane lipoprotein-sorting protein [Treponema phagedenis]
MSKNINKISIGFFSFFICAAFAISENITADYDSFLKLNTIYVESENSLLTKVKVKNEKEDKDIIAVYCLFHKQGQCIQIQSKSGTQYFFSSSQGYWVFNKKLKTPLKISGSYKAEEFEVQDILKTDFRNDYQMSGEESETLILERKTKKTTYHFILFKKIEESYELIFCDSKKNKLRKITYYPGKVNGFPCFYKIDIENLLFKKDSVSSWITEEVKTVSVPSSLFSLSNIKQLTQKMSALTE